MKILVLLGDGFGGSGGISKFNIDLLTALSSYDKITEVVAIPRIINNDSYFLPKKLSYLTEGKNNKIRFIKAFIKLLMNNKLFDLIICGHLNLVPLGFIASKIYNKPFITIIHGMESWQPHNNPLINYLVTRVDHFISVSEFTKDMFISWSNVNEKHFYILPNSVDIDRYGIFKKNEALLEKYHLSGKKVLMTLSRLDSSERYKGIDEILEILPELITKMPKLSYLIVGEGSDRSRLEKKASSLNIGDHVVFTGYILESSKADHYSLADVFVMPGRGEGFGIVYLEALASGLPVIGSKLDGSREALLNGKLGFVVDPRHRHEIKNAIFSALELPKCIPAELTYFSFFNYKKRLYDILDTL